MKSTPVFVFCLLVGSAAFTNTVQSLAENAPTGRAQDEKMGLGELNEVELKRIQELQTRIEKNIRINKDIREQVFKLNHEIFKLNQELNLRELRSEVLKDETRLVAERIMTLREQIQESWQTLGQSAVFLRMKSKSPEKALVWQKSNGIQRNRQLYLLSKISEKQINQLRLLYQDHEEVRLRQDQFINQKNILKSAESNLKQQRQALDQRRQQQLLKQSRIRKENENLLAEIREIQQSLQRVKTEETQFFLSDFKKAESQLSKWLGEKFFEKRNRVPWPIEGAVVKNFGSHRVAPNVHLMQKGIWIRPHLPFSEVRAVSSGKVSAIRNIPGFGLTLVLEHSDEYYTIYGGLDRAAVEIDGAVLSNQKIGQASDELYFEIRHFTEPFDPRSWLVASSSAQAQKSNSHSR